MHKLILISAIVLASTAAHAAGARGLITVASTERTETRPVEPVKPGCDDGACSAAVANPADAGPADATNQRIRHKVRHESDRDWTERRIRRELARYGIY